MRATRGRVVTAVTVLVLSCVYAVLAVTSSGSHAATLQLTDGSVWVTRTAQGWLARFDDQIDQLDAQATPPDAAFDVLQEGYTVIEYAPAAGTIRSLDTAAVSLGTAVTVPRGFTASLGGGALAIAARGEAWVLPAADPAAFQLDHPTLTGVDAVAVGEDGVVHAYSVTTGRLTAVSLRPDGSLASSNQPLTLQDNQPSLQMSAVGGVPVLLDRNDDSVTVGGHTVRVPATAGTPADIAVQQPGPANGVVYVASDLGLYAVPLGGGAAQPVALSGTPHVSGAPVAPVYDAGCAYAAWGQSSLLAERCNASQPAGDWPIPSLTAGADLEFRVNGDVVVLNDTYGGNVWVVQRGVHQVAQWTTFESALNPAPQHHPNGPAAGLESYAQHNKPPVARDVTLGARAGESTPLPVLDFDSDPNGDVLSIASPQALSAGDGTLQIVANGTAFEYTPPPGMTSGQVSFPYTITDGAGGNDVSKPATVTVHIDPASVESPPRPVSIPAYRVAAGRTITFDALTDWYDPEGDPFELTAVHAPPGDGVSFSPDGQVSVAATGKPGPQTIRLSVSDSLGETGKGQVVIDVGAPGTLLAPQTNPFLATTVAGVPATLQPLGVDSDPNDYPLALSSVTESTATRGAPGVDVAPDLQSGDIQFLATRPGTYYLQYVATDVPPEGSGKSSQPTSVRIDVVAPDATGAPVLERQVASLAPGGSTIVPVLDGATDPAGKVLVVQAVSAPPSTPLQASVYQNEAVRLTTSGLLPGPVALTYTVSDGAQEATGDITVLPAPPAATALAPVAEPLQAVVRAGDVGEIGPLAVDFAPDGSTLTLVPGSVRIEPAVSHFGGSEHGFAFADGALVRYEAPPQPGEAVLSYSVSDAGGQVASSTIDVTIAPDDPVAQAPAPAPIEASVIAGSAVDLPVQLAGVDPSGEAVELLGPASAPQLGRVTQVTGNTMIYQSFPGAHGTDTFEYAVSDQSGLVGDGVVRIGVAPPAPLDAPPVAVPQTVEVLPHHSVRYPVLAQDYDPQGYRITFASNDVTAKGTSASVAGADLLVAAPPETAGQPARASVLYQITDGFGPPVPGILTVVDAPRGFSQPPVAQDVVVPYLTQPAAKSVLVDVLSHVTDPAGSNADLQVVGFPGASAPLPSLQPGGKVSIPLTSSIRVVVYEVRGADGTASATITVPARGTDQPVARPGAGGFSTRENTSYTASIGQFVLDPAGRPLRIVSRAGVSAAEGRAIPLSSTTFRFDPTHDYAGPASVSLQVTDGPPGDESAPVSTILLAVDVVGDVPPSFRGPTVEVALGQRASIPLLPYVVDTNPDVTSVHFSGLSATPALGARIKGASLDLLPQGALAGTTQIVSFSLTDGVTRAVAGEVAVDVVGTTRPLAVAPPQTAAVDQGRSVTIAVLQTDVNPFAGGQPLRVVSARVVGGQGNAVTDGTTVTFTAGATFSGTATVVYALEDQTHELSRIVDGTITVTVYGRPGVPGAPSVVGSGSETVLLAWSAPPDNGQPIVRYVIQGGPRPVTATGTTATITGLQNGISYRFTVAAVNAVGQGPTSQPSAPVTPNEVPPQLPPPTTQFASHAIEVYWTAPPRSFVGTAVVDYELQISPGGSTVAVKGTSYRWSGLQNGTAYTFTVLAVNAKGAGPPSAPSAPQIPAGVPGAPGQPSAQAVPKDPTGGKVEVQWPAVHGTADDGAQVTYYTLRTYEGTSEVGSPLRVVPTSGVENPITVTLSGLSNSTAYSFTVTATNKAGTSQPSPNSSEFTVYGQPSPITDLAAANYQNQQTTLTFSQPSSNGQAIGSYQYSQDGGSWQPLQASGTSAMTATVGGLTNGTTYSFQVEACNTYCGNPSNTASAEPDGNPTPPQPSASVNGTTFNFSWGTGTPDGCSVPSNGYRYSISAQGGGPNGPWTSTSGPGNVSYSGGYNQTVTIYLSVVDSCGNASTSSTSASATSGPPPPPPQSVTITGPVGPAVTCSGTGGTCYWVGISGSGFPGGTRVNYSCAEVGQSAWWSYHVTTTSGGTVSLPQGSGASENGCQFGAPGTYITATVDGVTSAPYKWPAGYG